MRVRVSSCEFVTVRVLVGPQKDDSWVMSKEMGYLAHKIVKSQRVDTYSLFID